MFIAASFFSSKVHLASPIGSCTSHTQEAFDINAAQGAAFINLCAEQGRYATLFSPLFPLNWCAHDQTFWFFLFFSFLPAGRVQLGWNVELKACNVLTPSRPGACIFAQACRIGFGMRVITDTSCWSTHFGSESIVLESVLEPMLYHGDARSLNIGLVSESSVLLSYNFVEYHLFADPYFFDE